MSHRSVFEAVKRATVAIVAMNTSDSRHPFTTVGSGFCVDPVGFVATCRHVVDALMEKSMEQQIAEVSEEEKKKPIQILGPVNVITPYVVFYLPRATQVIAILSRVDSVIAKSDFDLALLRLWPHTAFQSGYPFLEIEEYEAVGEGEDIATCGFPLGNYLQDQLGTITSSFTKGIISSIIPAPGVAREHLKGFQLGLSATHGNSGGPVFSSSTGKVFGVLQRGVMDSSGAILSGLTKAEPVYPIVNDDLLARAKRRSLGTPLNVDDEF
jgi:S1-C subfamily serine protease